MPKPHYFHQTEADADDHRLTELKVEGVVPDGCLLGGEVVAKLAGREQNDPCAWCVCPERDRCGGRQQTENVDTYASGMPDIERLRADAAGGRKLVRTRIREVLSRLVQDAQKEPPA